MSSLSLSIAPLIVRQTNLEPLANLIAKRFRIFPILLRNLLNLQPMFIRPGRKLDLTLRVSQTGVPRQDVCEEEGVKMTYMRSWIRRLGGQWN